MFVKMTKMMILTVGNLEYVSSSSTMCGCLSMWQMVASLFRSSRERPGEEVNFATSTT